MHFKIWESLDWRYGSELELLPGLHEALGLVPSTAKNRTKPKQKHDTQKLVNYLFLEFSIGYFEIAVNHGQVKPWCGETSVKNTFCHFKFSI